MTTASTATDERQEHRAAALYAGDQQVRAAAPLDSVDTAIRQPGLSLQRVVATVMEGYADRPVLGERAKELVTDPATGRTTLELLPRFETITYGELWDRVGAVVAEWHHDSQNPLAADEFVAVLGFTSTDYATIDLACTRIGAVCVPLQAGATAGHLKPIIAETGPRILAASVENLGTAVEAIAESASVRRLLVFDYHAEVDEQREQFEAARQQLAESGSTVVLDTLADVIARGQKLPPAPEFDPGPAGDRLTLLIYTSGSTGTPKGAMYTDRLVRELWFGFWPVKTGRAVLSVNYMPMSHIAGRALLLGAMADGGTSYFVAKSDVSTLFEDIELARPTELMMVPRICDMLFQRYQSMLDTSSGTEEEVKAQLREKVLGGRLLWVGSGSAPLSAEMTAFVESCIGLPLHDGYGSTEAGAVLLDHLISRERVTDYKLVDVPELGYFTTDVPHPRGELLIKSSGLVPGYFKRPDATAEVFDDDGFYRTGDIMAEVGPDELVYLDRSKNVLKLSQGEFVAVSRLEAVFATSPLVRQIYVYGSSERAYLLAVVVPTPEALEHGGDLKAAVAESLQRIAKEADLNSYEIPRDFLLETEPFTPENGLLSGIRKLLRPKLKEFYGERLEQFYQELADREANELRALRRTGRDEPVFDTVVRAALAVLSSSAGELAPDAHFMDLGGDSLSALSFSTLLKEIFDVEVPVGVVISPANDLRHLAAYIEAARESGTQRPTFASVHGEGATVARAADLTLDKFIDPETLAAAKDLPRPSGQPRTVLLTGSNGYLGRFLCLEWLERLDETGGKLICIVRGSTAEAASKRLEDAFDSGDAELLRHFRELAAEHLEVLAGDIGDADLGLDEPTWRRLADSVDLIVHPAALVNHVLPYDQLFGPNVVGTAELIRLALTTRIKPVTYLSTVGVFTEEAAGTDEYSDIRVTCPVRTINEEYASGYGTSKWAGEVLLREAYDLAQLPVATFRSDMILAHSRYAGQLNVPDMFTRLLLSLIVTGIAPRSFYAGDRPAHYDGLPVDFTAEAITTVGLAEAEGYRTYNVMNPHEDGISLDVYVDWLNEAGYRIQRIDDYADWFARFDRAIRGLPELQKQHSLLPLLHAFARPAEPVDGAGDIPTERFRTAVQTAKVGADKDIPHVSAELIRKYAADLKGLNLLL